jgi:hypothetical protein
MITPSATATLEAELTDLALSTPGIVRLYPPVQTVPGLGTAHRLLDGLGAPVPVIGVLVDEGTHTLTASLGLDFSAPAAEILQTLCTRLEEHLTRSPGAPHRIKLTIVHIVD